MVKNCKDWNEGFKKTKAVGPCGSVKAPLSQRRRWRKFLETIWQASPHNKDRLISFGIDVIIDEINKHNK